VPAFPLSQGAIAHTAEDIDRYLTVVADLTAEVVA